MRFRSSFNVNVTGTVVSYMNSTSPETILPNFLQQSIDLNSFRCMTPESKSKAALFETISQILLFYVFFYCLLAQKAYLKINIFRKIQFFAVEFIHTCDDIFSSRFNYLCKFHLIAKLKRINNKLFLRILLLLSGDISLNPGPVYNNQSLHQMNGMSLDQKEST